MHFFLTEDFGMVLVFGWYFGHCPVLSSSDGKVGGCSANGGLLNKFSYYLIWVFSELCICDGGLSMVDVGMDGTKDDGE